MFLFHFIINAINAFIIIYAIKFFSRLAMPKTRPFVCSKCQMGFNRKGFLAWHESLRICQIAKKPPFNLVAYLRRKNQHCSRSKASDPIPHPKSIVLSIKQKKAVSKTRKMLLALKESRPFDTAKQSAKRKKPQKHFNGDLGMKGIKNTQGLFEYCAFFGFRAKKFRGEEKASLCSKAPSRLLVSTLRQNLSPMLSNGGAFALA